MVCENVPTEQCLDVRREVCGLVPVTVEEEVVDTVCSDVPATRCETVETSQCTNTTAPTEVCHEVNTEVCADHDKTETARTRRVLATKSKFDMDSLHKHTLTWVHHSPAPPPAPSVNNCLHTCIWPR